MNKKAKAVTIEQVPIGALRPDPFNPRRISDAELEALTRSLQEFGFVDPVIARRADKTVVGGHQRLLAARRLGYTEVPVVFVDLSAEQAKLLNLALNKISGEWDQELLARLLKDLSASPEVDLTLSGFAEDEVKKLLKRLEQRDKAARPETFDLDAALEDASRKEPMTQPADLWLLGDHRLLCGDSTSPEDVARLMDGRKATLLATDPPYLVDYTGNNRPNPRNRIRKQVHWDEYVDPETSVDFYRRFLEAGLPHCQEGVALYQWHATRRQALVEQAWTALGLLWHQTIIWVKTRVLPTRSHYLWRHEPCAYGWVQGKEPQRRPPEKESTVWEVDYQSLHIHPTQKPVELFLRPIQYHTEADEVCYEPFCGSGTQIIAAERLGRRCFALEKEPTYVDVAVARWEAFTGEKAKKG